jgi:hypothetical protein
MYYISIMIRNATQCASRQVSKIRNTDTELRVATK